MIATTSVQTGVHAQAMCSAQTATLTAQSIAQQDICVAPLWSTVVATRVGAQPVPHFPGHVDVPAPAPRAATAQSWVHLETLRNQHPSIADYFDYQEGRERLDDEQASSASLDAACRLLARARTSTFSALRARADIAWVECLLRSGNEDAEAELQMLERRYPDLPRRSHLRFLLATHYSERGDATRAQQLYREVDFRWPGSGAAALARTAVTGTSVRPFSNAERIARAERLLATGPLAMARETMVAISASRLSATERTAIDALLHRLDRYEGNSSETTEPSRELALEARLQKVLDARHGTAWRRVPTERLVGIMRLAARLAVATELDAATAELARREDVPCGTRLRAGTIVSGSASLAPMLALLSPCRARTDTQGIAAEYYIAREFQRSGRYAEARFALENVLARDRNGTRFYGIWASALLQNLPTSSPDRDLQVDATTAEPNDEVSAVAESVSANDDELATNETEESLENVPREDIEQLSVFPAFAGDSDVEDSSCKWPDDKATMRMSVAPTAPMIRPSPPQAPRPVAAPEPAENPWFEQPVTPRFSRGEMLEALHTLSVAHRIGFPWFERAHALAQIGQDDDAAAELFEAQLAFAEARGVATTRAGYVAVLRGGIPPRIGGTVEERAERRSLSAEERIVLADIAESLGDFGLAIRFGGPERASRHPRPYEAIVETAARNANIDPNLLFAVMRVESVFNPRIVSYAGAVGLLQIMPRTGALIARNHDQSDFNTADMLRPEVNIQFSAWYLSSLLRRFHGRLPLAIASYNGGPHNVRTWMAQYARAMPVDAFCEQIPFEQTHRYVRRVLSHYAVYRAQAGLTPPELETSLPTLERDRVGF